MPGEGIVGFLRNFGRTAGILERVPQGVERLFRVFATSLPV